MRAALSIIFIWLACCCACMAYTYTGQGWTPNFYPTIDVDGRETFGLTARNWSDPHTGIGTRSVGSPKDIWVGDFYHALYQRYKSLTDLPSYTVLRRDGGVNIGPPTAPAWYRSERSSLVAYKAWITNAIKAYYNLPATGAGLNSYISALVGTNEEELTRSSGYTYITNWVWSITGICAAAGAPTNYFDYTPWRNLGGNNNTATDEHCYSSFTLADYGWKHMRGIISNLNVSCFGGQFLPATNVGVNAIRCESTNFQAAPPWPAMVLCTNLTLTAQAGLFMGVYGIKQGTVPMQLSRTAKQDARIGINYVNIYGRSMEVYFCPVAPNHYAGSPYSIYSGPWNQSSNLNTIVHQLSVASSTESNWTYRVADLETPPVPPDVANSYEGWFLSDWQNTGFRPRPIAFVTWSYYYP